MRLPCNRFGEKSRFVRRIAEPVATQDDRYGVWETGFAIKRPDDERGDSVNTVCVGGRFDALTELCANDDDVVKAATAREDADNLEGSVA